MDDDADFDQYERILKDLEERIDGPGWDNAFQDLSDLYPIRPLLSGNLTASLRQWQMSSMHPLPTTQTEGIRSDEWIAHRQYNSPSGWWPRSKRYAIKYLENLFNIGSWELVHVALLAEWHQIHQKWANRQMHDYKSSRYYFFSLLGVRYAPFYDLENYEFFFKEILGNVTSPANLADAFKQVQENLKVTFGNVEMTDELEAISSKEDTLKDVEYILRRRYFEHEQSGWFVSAEKMSHSIATARLPPRYDTGIFEKIRKSIQKDMEEYLDKSMEQGFYELMVYSKFHRYKMRKTGPSVYEFVYAGSFGRIDDSHYDSDGPDIELTNYDEIVMQRFLREYILKKIGEGSFQVTSLELAMEIVERRWISPAIYNLDETRLIKNIKHLMYDLLKKLLEESTLDWSLGNESFRISVKQNNDDSFHFQTC